MLKDYFYNSVYVVSDSVAVLEQAVNDGAAVIQLRDKSGNKQLVGEKARELIAFKKGRQFCFIINDEPELARELGADGVHIGQDFSTLKARLIVGPCRLVGKSIGSLEAGRQAQKDGADYIAVGPVFATPVKPQVRPVGLELVRAAGAEIDLPLVAIGGIDAGNILQVMAAGANSIAVVRAAKNVPLLLNLINSL
jgi:thiamine-phosphate pyrophosphorylase